MAKYKEEMGRDVIMDFALWEPCHMLLLRNGIMGYENIGGDIDEFLGKRVILAGFPIRLEKGDGPIVGLVANVNEGD